MYLTPIPLMLSILGDSIPAGHETITPTKGKSLATILELLSYPTAKGVHIQDETVNP